MASQLTYLSDSESATDSFAALCAGCIRHGLTIALNGQLGSGKTRFVRAFCAALGVDPKLVTSPTFVLLQLYASEPWTICHFDTYRLGDADEFTALGADEYLTSPDCLCLVEWADRVAEILPSDHVSITMRQTGASQRMLELSAGGPTSSEFVAAVERQLNNMRQ